MPTPETIERSDAPARAGSMSAAAAAAAQMRVPAGHVLATLRNRLAFSTEHASSALGITERHLIQIESGIRSATGPLIDRMAELYGVDAAELQSRNIVPRVPSGMDQARNVLWLGWLPIELDAVDDNEALLESISRNIRSMRCLGDSQPIYIRATDLRLLAAVLDLNDPELPGACMRHLKLTLMESMELLDALDRQPSASERPFSA